MSRRAVLLSEFTAGELELENLRRAIMHTQRLEEECRERLDYLFAKRAAQKAELFRQQCLAPGLGRKGGAK